MIISSSLCVLTILLSLRLPDASVQAAVPEVCYQCEGQVCVCVISQVVVVVEAPQTGKHEQPASLMRERDDHHHTSPSQQQQKQTTDFTKTNV